MVYVSELRPGATFDFKPVTREYADALRALGLHVVSCYQYGKPGWPTPPSDFTREYDGGVADVETALRLHAADRRRALPERHRHRVRPWYQPGWYPRGRGRGTRGRFRAMGSGEIVLGCRSHQSVEKGVCHFLTGHSGVPGYEGASIHRPLSRALLVRAIDRRGRFEPIHLHSVLGAASLQSQCEGCFFRPAPRPSGRPHAVAEATPSPHESRCLRTSMGGVLATVPS